MEFIDGLCSTYSRNGWGRGTFSSTLDVDYLINNALRYGGWPEDDQVPAVVVGSFMTYCQKLYRYDNDGNTVVDGPFIIFRHIHQKSRLAFIGGTIDGDWYCSVCCEKIPHKGLLAALYTRNLR